MWNRDKNKSILLHGDNKRTVNSHDFIKVFGELFDTLLYEKIRLKSTARSIDRTYTDNSTFWQDVRCNRHFESMRASLQHFHLTEWIPSAPGRYFTPEAASARSFAQNHIFSKQEYLPLGKEYMILGGVGSVRLSAKTVDTKKTYFLGASSTGVSHEGIPLALPESKYHKVIQVIKEHGGCFVNVIGSLQVIPEATALVQYDRGVLRYCLYVEDIEIIRQSEQRELLTTVAIMFPTKYAVYGDREHKLTRDGYTTDLVKSWAFCSFRPSADEGNLEAAVDWLKRYLVRHTTIYSDKETRKYIDQLPILHDFDEHKKHFEQPVEFPLSDLSRHKIDLERLRTYAGYYGITIIEEVVMGDKFSNIGANTTIVNRSTVQNAFNKIKSEYDEETAQALKCLEEEINKSGSREAAENFDSFNEELQKSEPKKSVLRALWTGIVAALPDIAKMTDIATKVTKLFTG